MDLRLILRSPWVYMAFQAAVGGLYARNRCLELLAVKSGERVLDIGCGPAYYRRHLPEIEYFGFDTDARYIEHARSHFGHNGTFFCDEFGPKHPHGLGQFDCVILMGLLHHLVNQYCNETLALIASSLRPSGRVLALDTAIHSDQSYFEKRFAQSDRGNFVRRPEEFESLAVRHFSNVHGQLIRAWWIPSIYWAMVLKEPRTIQN